MHVHALIFYHDIITACYRSFISDKIRNWSYWEYFLVLSTYCVVVTEEVISSVIIKLPCSEETKEKCIVCGALQTYKDLKPWIIKWLKKKIFWYIGPLLDFQKPLKTGAWMFECFHFFLFTWYARVRFSKTPVQQLNFTFWTSVFEPIELMFLRN